MIKCLMEKEINKELREKILKGIELSFERLLLIKIKEDSDFVFSKDGKIIRIKAKDFVKE